MFARKEREVGARAGYAAYMAYRGRYGREDWFVERRTELRVTMGQQMEQHEATHETYLSSSAIVTRLNAYH